MGQKKAKLRDRKKKTFKTNFDKKPQTFLCTSYCHLVQYFFFHPQRLIARGCSKSHQLTATASRIQNNNNAHKVEV
jgi:hypothetical protein